MGSGIVGLRDIVLVQVVCWLLGQHIHRGFPIFDRVSRLAFLPIIEHQ